MPKSSYKSKSGSFEMEFEYSTQKELFERIAEFEEVFGVSSCGACGSANIRPSVRKVEDFTYYEYHCDDCQCRLQMGQNKKGGGLFPKREGGKNGWAKPDFVPKQAAQPTRR